MKKTRIEPRDSQAVSKILEAYVGDLIAESNFFSDLSSGQANLEDVRGVFGQYYLWRNQFHRWFGICVARSAPFGESLNVPRILGELIACLGQEIKGRSPRAGTVIPGSPRHRRPAADYSAPCDRHLRGVVSPLLLLGRPQRRRGAGRLSWTGTRRTEVATELSSVRFPRHYGVTSGLEFFDLHNTIEVAHFRVLWEAMTHDHKADTGRLIEAARLEIWEHMAFWDDVYCAILETRSELSCAEVPAAILRTTRRSAGSRSMSLRSAPGHA